MQYGWIVCFTNLCSFIPDTALLLSIFAIVDAYLHYDAYLHQKIILWWRIWVSN